MSPSQVALDSQTTHMSRPKLYERWRKLWRTGPTTSSSKSSKEATSSKSAAPAISRGVSPPSYTTDVPNHIRSVHSTSPMQSWAPSQAKRLKPLPAIPSKSNPLQDDSESPPPYTDRNHHIQPISLTPSRALGQAKKLNPPAVTPSWRILLKDTSILRSAFLVLFIFIVESTFTSSTKSINFACYLPWVSGFARCDVAPPDSRKSIPLWADFTKLVEVQSDRFDDLLSGVGSPEIAADITRVELATSDLVTAVQLSDLRSRELLADSLIDFVRDAATTGEGLQTLNVKVLGVVDGIMEINQYALHSIEAASAQSPSLMASLASWVRPSQASTSEVVNQMFAEVMTVQSTSLTRLILEARVSLSNLNKLGERLKVIHELVSREDSAISTAKAELLSKLWTKLGFNGKDIKTFNDNLSLLKNVGKYREQARNHVVAALLALRGMDAEMKEMREKVSAPDITGSSIPVEVHMRSIQRGLERLQIGRLRAIQREEEAMKMVSTGD